MYEVSVKLPDENTKLVGTFKTRREAEACRLQWHNDPRLNQQVVTIKEVQV